MHNKKKAIGELIAFKNGADFVAKQFDPWSSSCGPASKLLENVHNSKLYMGDCIFNDVQRYTLI